MARARIKGLYDGEVVEVVAVFRMDGPAIIMKCNEGEEDFATIYLEPSAAMGLAKELRSRAELLLSPIERIAWDCED